MQGEVIDGLIGLAAAHWLFAGHDENYEGVKRVALETSAIIPDLPAVSSPATMGEEKKREKKEKRKEPDTHSFKEQQKLTAQTDVEGMGCQRLGAADYVLL